MRRFALVLLAACGRLGFQTVDPGTDAALTDGAFAQSRQAYIKASNADADDYFGMTVALSADGTTFAVAAPHEDSSATGINRDQGSNGAMDSGAVYIFVRDGGWKQQAYIKASNTDAGDNFGCGIALSADGNTLAVGACGEDGRPGDPADNSRPDAGAVYIFVRASANWTEQALLKASNAEAGDFFGSVVALSSDGNTLAVGAPEEDGAATGVDGNPASNASMNSGAAYVFTRSARTWTQQAYIKASNTDVADTFGSAIALSGDGDTLAVGAAGEDSAATGIDGDGTDNSAKLSGAAYVYTRTAATWNFQAYLKASNTDASDRFGFGVALSGDGNVLAVSAPFEGSAATGIDGDQQDNTAGLSGAVYIFSRAKGSWARTAYIKSSNTGSRDSFGERVALTSDGATLAVSAIGEASGNPADPLDDTADEAGAVYVFAFDQRWTQTAYIKAPHPDAFDIFGYGLALCSTAIAAGAYNEASSATGVDGDAADNSTRSAGAAYLFAR